MGMVVRTNTMALNAYRQLGMNNSAVAKSLEKLSSGFRINRAGDDAAGLAISEKMKAQITGLETASANAQDGISLIQTAEGNLTEVHSMLNRMVELATKSANGTYSETERSALQDEVNALKEEINRISKSANFNGINLLDGSLGYGKNALEGVKIEGIGAVTADNGDVSIGDENFPVTTADGTNLHFTTLGNNTEEDPSFTVDLTNLTADASKATTSLTISFAGVTVDIALATNGGTNGDGKYTASDIATALKSSLISGNAASFSTNAGTSGAGVNGDAAKIGEFVFDIDVQNGKLTFNYKSMASATAAGSGTDATTKTFTAEQATALNSLVGSGVTIGFTSGANTTNVSFNASTVFHDIVDVNPAKAITDSVTAGIDFKLTESIVQDGYQLTIDDKTFVFQTKKTDSAADSTAGTVIDVSDGATIEEQIHLAVDKLSQAANNTTANFQIESKSSDTIHIDQFKNSTEKYTELQDLKDVFSLNKGTTIAGKDAGTKITLTPDKLSSGESVKVGDKEFVFTRDEALLKQKTDGNKTYVDITDPTKAAQNLAAAISSGTVEATASGNEVSLFGKGADAGKIPDVVGHKGLILQIGDTADAFNKMTVDINDMSVNGLDLADISIMSADSSSEAIKRIKDAINTVSTARAGMGALQNRLEHTINNLDVAVENLNAANSRIRDTDMAKEMMNYTKMNVLVQSAQAMLAQANQQPQSVLQLLQ